MTTGTGFAYLRAQKEAISNRSSGGGSNPRLNKLWLREDEVASFYFINDISDIGAPLVHIVDRVSKNNKRYFADVICQRDSVSDSPSKCYLCVDGAKGPWPRAVSLVYVEYIVHKELRDGVNWQAKHSGGKPVYIETVNDTWLLVMKDKIIDQLFNYVDYGSIEEDPQEQSTILDRPFKLKVTGSGKNKVETLIGARDPIVTIPEGVVNARNSAPNLEDVMATEFKDWERNSNNATVASGFNSRGNSEATVNYTDDDDDDDIDFE